jgi:N-acetylmuramoyl-L-alanine amidase
MRSIFLALVAAALALSAAAPAAALPLVAVDPGHGGADTGAVGPLPAGTETGLPPRVDEAGQTVIYEKDVTLDVGRRLAAWLGGRGFPVLLTRNDDTGGGDLPYRGELEDLQARVAVANRAGAEMFVSIHENAFVDPAIRGTETYHFSRAGAPARALAVAIHEEVMLRLGLPDRGVQSAGFHVLKHTVMPAVLVEGGFLTNPDEAGLLARPEARQALAEGIGAGVADYVESDAPGLTGPAAPAAAPLYIRYRVTAGRFRRRADALARVAALRKGHMEAVIRRRYTPTVRRTLFYVVTGQFVFLSNARGQREALRAMGFPAMVGRAAGSAAAAAVGLPVPAGSAAAAPTATAPVPAQPESAAPAAAPGAPAPPG